MNNVNKTSTGQKPKESRGRNAATVFLVGSVEGSTTGVSATARFSRPNPRRCCCRFLRGSGHIVHGGPGPEMLAARRTSVMNQVGQPVMDATGTCMMYRLLPN